MTTSECSGGGRSRRGGRREWVFGLGSATLLLAACAGTPRPVPGQAAAPDPAASDQAAPGAGEFQRVGRAWVSPRLWPALKDDPGQLALLGALSRQGPPVVLLARADVDAFAHSPETGASRLNAQLAGSGAPQGLRVAPGLLRAGTFRRAPDGVETGLAFPALGHYPGVIIIDTAARESRSGDRPQADPPTAGARLAAVIAHEYMHCRYPALAGPGQRLREEASAVNAGVAAGRRYAELRGESASAVADLADALLRSHGAARTGLGYPGALGFLTRADLERCRPEDLSGCVVPVDASEERAIAGLLVEQAQSGESADTVIGHLACSGAAPEGTPQRRLQDSARCFLGISDLGRGCGWTRFDAAAQSNSASAALDGAREVVYAPILYPLRSLQWAFTGRWDGAVAQAEPSPFFHVEGPIGTGARRALAVAAAR